MKEKIRKWLKPVLFTAGGALVGLRNVTALPSQMQLKKWLRCNHF